MLDGWVPCSGQLWQGNGDEKEDDIRNGCQDALGCGHQTLDLLRPPHNARIVVVPVPCEARVTVAQESGEHE